MGVSFSVPTVEDLFMNDSKIRKIHQTPATLLAKGG